MSNKKKEQNCEAVGNMLPNKELKVTQVIKSAVDND